MRLGESLYLRRRHHPVVIGVELGKIGKLRGTRLFGRDFAVVIGVQLLDHLIDDLLQIGSGHARGEFLEAELAVVVGVELLELALEALLDRARLRGLELGLGPYPVVIGVDRAEGSVELLDEICARDGLGTPDGRRLGRRVVSAGQSELNRSPRERR